MRTRPRALIAPTAAGWRRSEERATLLALYAEADALLAGWTCACTASPPPGEAADTPCCHFGVTGREPYPTAVELQEVSYAMRAAGITLASAAPARARGGAAAPSPARRALPLAARGPTGDERRPCPLLSDAGRCRIYASRPFGCRTFFCQGAEAPFGARTKPPRDAANALGRRIADLSARFAPRDPHPRALTKSLASSASRVDGVR